MEKIFVFDFDGTLFNTPEPERGKVIFKQKTGIDWPYRGWWSKKESLDTKIFDIKPIDWVYRKYLESLHEENHVILATGRMEELRNQVNKILVDNNTLFDKVYLNPGMDTFVFKVRVFDSLIEKHSPEEFTIYDDRDAHLVKFKEWSETKNININIIDVKTKEKI